MTKLRKARVEKGLSRAKLCNKVGISVRALQYTENQEHSIYSLHFDIILKLCIELELSLTDIFADEPGILEDLQKVLSFESGEVDINSSYPQTLIYKKNR